METPTQVLIRMANLMGLDNISGRMEVYTLENLKMGRSMARVNGRKLITLRTVILMTVSIPTIRRMALVSSNGKVEMYSKDVIKMMKEMDTVKCIGLMEATTRVNGDKVSNMVWAR